MLICTLVTVKLPPDMPVAELQRLRQAETEIAQRYQREGKMRHLWRVAGKAANVSVWDCTDPDEFHALISTMPLFPYMEVEVIPLAKHPSDIS